MEIHEGYANWLIHKASRLMQGDAKKMMKMIKESERTACREKVR